MIEVNGKIIYSSIFPGGEVYIRLENQVYNNEYVYINAHLYNSDSLMMLLMTVNALRKISGSFKIDLNLNYFPYARQDRVCSPLESFSLQVMCDLINSLKFNTITILDPHSNITPSLLNNCQVITLKDILQNFNFDGLKIVCPDAGAIKRIETLADDYILALKKRDKKTGEVFISNIYGEVEGKNLIIIDDICDGGATFIALSKRLKNLGANEIYLYVTHGIFSKGIDVLKTHFNRIYCKYSFHNYNSEFISYV